MFFDQLYTFDLQNIADLLATRFGPRDLSCYQSIFERTTY